MIILGAIFTDHAILQRDKYVPIWGETDGKGVQIELWSGELKKLVAMAERVTCELVTDDAKGAVVPPPVDGDGFDWQGRKSFVGYLPPVEASGPYCLVIREAGDNEENDEKNSRIILNDIWFGEVFLAGGQSNMEFNLKDSRNGYEEAAGSANPEVRFYFTPKIAYIGEELFEQERSSCWALCGPGTADYFSAVGYYFAKDIQPKLGCKVGVINCNWGGTSATCWISRKTNEQYGELLPYLEAYDKAVGNQSEEEYLKALEEYREYDIRFSEKLAKYYATAEFPTWEGALKVCGECRYPGPMGPRTWCRPNGLYESMLKRVAPYALKAFLFYQAEEDDNRPFTYATLLPVLMNEWRSTWKEENIPFLLVQLPGYNGEDPRDLMNWPIIREIQQKTADRDPNCAMAVTIDLGHPTNIHPVDKKPVGERLSLQAQYLLYHMISEEEASGPVFDSVYYHDNRAEVYFKNVKGSLKLKQPEYWNPFNPDTAGEGFIAGYPEHCLYKITGFELAGEDKIYYPATVTKKYGRSVTLESEKVPKPCYTRYLWRNYQNVILYGSNGIPVAPFRSSTDDGSKPIGSRQGGLLDAGE